MEKLNTHFYDGHVNPEVSTWCTETTKTITQSQKLAAIKSLEQKLLLAKASPLAMRNFKYITATNTFDPSNKLYVFDLLYILDRASSADAMKNIELQLEEMSSGLCPQGQTTRIFQLIFPFVMDGNN
jgi:hypothetical protein